MNKHETKQFWLCNVATAPTAFFRDPIMMCWSKLNRELVCCHRLLEMVAPIKCCPIPNRPKPGVCRETSRHLQLGLWLPKNSIFHGNLGYHQPRPWWQTHGLRRRPQNISSHICGDQNRRFSTGSPYISSLVCGNRTECLEGDLRTFLAMFVVTKTGIISQTMMFF